MRKSHEKVCRAFLAAEPAHSGNMETDGRELRLFGNVIAKWEKQGTEPAYVIVTWAGWYSRTTMAALNALAECKGGDLRFLMRQGVGHALSTARDTHHEVEMGRFEWWVLT